MRVGTRRYTRIRQRGIAFLLSVVTLVLGAAAIFYGFSSPSRLDVMKDKKTTMALAQAKLALIGYAAGRNLLGSVRPGDLPCPDTNDSGSAGSPNCNAQVSRVGRLPWKELGLPDLRDGDGERLWYAVSNNFKKDVRTACDTPNAAGCLNSDTRGTITIRDAAGNIVHDAANSDPASSGVIAVVFSPGAVLKRQGATTQDRSCTGGSCTLAGICTSSPAISTPKCNPVNYLDVVVGIENNADFVDGSSANGFISGIVRDSNGNIIVNDRLITITYQDLMPLLEKRVAKEALDCLTTYAGVPQNNGRYPWAAPLTATAPIPGPPPATDPPYADQANTRFGRLPDTFVNTVLGIGGPVANAVCPSQPELCMKYGWPTECVLTQSWWGNWKERVFYGVAQSYQPADPILSRLPEPPVPPGGPCGGCLVVNPPSSATDKQVVVIVSGKKLASVGAPPPQQRGTALERQQLTNYLEGENNNLDSIYAKQLHSTTFNDTVVYK